MLAPAKGNLGAGNELGVGIHEAIDATKETAVQQAIEDGVITAEQAEQLENSEGGHGGKHGDRGPRGGNSPAPAGDNA